MIKSYHGLACTFSGRHNLSFTCIDCFTRVCNIGQMWGALRRRHQVFHIPLTDHGCKCTQVQNNSESLALAAKFSREVTRPAGSSWTPTGMCCCPVSFYTAHCLTGQLTGVIGLTLWEAAFRCMSQWSGDVTEALEYERKKQRHPAASAPYLQLLLPRTDTSREKVVLH